MNQVYALTLDLQNDPALIAAYEQYHQEVWPEIKSSILAAGIVEMQIYRWENRLFMTMEVDETFSFERKEAMDAQNPAVQQWEELMWKFQNPLPGTPAGSKWQLMSRIFALKK